MRQILEHGTSFYVIRCPHCKCKFLYQYTDISLMENSNNTYSYKIQCPECNTYIVPTKEIYNIDDNSDKK